MKRNFLIILLLITVGVFIWKLSDIYFGLDVEKYNQKVGMENLSRTNIEKVLDKDLFYLSRIKSSQLDTSFDNEATTSIRLSNDVITIRLSCDEKYQSLISKTSSTGIVTFLRNDIRSGPLKECTDKDIENERIIQTLLGHRNFKAIFYTKDGTFEMHIPSYDVIFFFSKKQ